jgi:hypothetical protein
VKQHQDLMRELHGPTLMAGVGEFWNS